MAPEPDPDHVSTVAQLRTLYREPSSLVKRKVQSALDPTTTAFLGRSTFVLVGTSSADGRHDVSPRGGPVGFVRVVDGRVVLPDLNGNNLLDTLTNVIETGAVGCLFVVPGRDETLRVNGRAQVRTDAALLDSFTELRRPTSVLVIEPTEVYIHCAKSFRRGGVWDASTWPAPDDRSTPDAVDILACHLDLPNGGEDLRPVFAAGIASDLAADLPE